MRLAGLMGPCLTLFARGLFYALCWGVFYLGVGYLLLKVLEHLIGGNHP